MNAKELANLVENFSWEDKELLSAPLKREIENNNIEIISQIKAWIAYGNIENINKVFSAVDEIAEYGSKTAISLLAEIERMLNSKRDIHEVIDSLRHAVSPGEYHEFYHKDDVVSEEYLDVKATIFYEELQRITDHIIKNGVNNIPDMTDDIIFANNMIQPLMDAWLQKPTHSIKCKFQEACWEAGRCDIEDWLKRRAEMLRKDGIDILADLDEKLFIRNESDDFVKV